MKVVVKSVLPCAAEKVWDEVNRSRLLLEVIRPVISFRTRNGEPLPERWKPETAQLDMRLFGLVPLGLHTIEFQRIDDARREILTHEFDGLIRTWDHLIRVEPIDDRSCLYSDEIEVEPQPRLAFLRPVAWLFATLFYRHRQRRWQTVARRLAAAPAA